MTPFGYAVLGLHIVSVLLQHTDLTTSEVAAILSIAGTLLSGKSPLPDQWKTLATITGRLIQVELNPVIDTPIPPKQAETISVEKPQTTV